MIADLKYRLRNFKNEHNPKYNGNCHFDGIKTGLDRQVKLICDRVCLLYTSVDGFADFGLRKTGRYHVHMQNPQTVSYTHLDVYKRQI